MELSCVFLYNWKKLKGAVVCLFSVLFSTSFEFVLYLLRILDFSSHHSFIFCKLLYGERWLYRRNKIKLICLHRKKRSVEYQSLERVCNFSVESTPARREIIQNWPRSLINSKIKLLDGRTSPPKTGDNNNCLFWMWFQFSSIWFHYPNKSLAIEKRGKLDDFLMGNKMSRSYHHSTLSSILLHLRERGRKRENNIKN